MLPNFDNMGKSKQKIFFNQQLIIVEPPTQHKKFPKSLQKSPFQIALNKEVQVTLIAEFKSTGGRGTRSGRAVFV